MKNIESLTEFFNQLTIERDESQLLTVKEAAQMLKTTESSIYTYLGNKKPGRNKFPKDIYVKIGRRTLFKRIKLIDWINNGAIFVK